MQVKNFEDLEIWKDARALTKGIYQLTRDSRFSKDFALRDQIRRAAVSIMSNIAEGFERGGNQEFIQFLHVSKASCGEARSQLYVALDQSYVTPKDCDDASKSFRRLSIMISNLIRTPKQCECCPTAVFGPTRPSSTATVVWRQSDPAELRSGHGAEMALHIDSRRSLRLARNFRTIR